MRTSVERLRIWLLVGAGLLVVVIAGFLGYARYRIHRAIGNLPGRMGATITKEFNGYTYSQSDGKRTIFTIHASKAVQHTDGKYALHDVNMILYGHKGDRADRISGDDFEYDTANGVIRAQGVVHLDLEAPVAPGSQTSDAAKHLGGAQTVEGSTDDGAHPGSRVIHVKTSGLVYMQKLGIAATDQGIDFAFSGFTGHAIGAEYSSDTGHVTLQSAVTASGIDRGHPVHLEAAHAELDRQSELATLTKAHYSSAEDTAESEVAQIHLRSDGTVESIEAEHNVRLEQDGQGDVTSDHASLALDKASKPTAAVLVGNVVFSSDDASRQVRGGSARANLDFDAYGHIDHALLQGSARAVERLYRSDSGQEPWSQRTLSGETVELLFAAQKSMEKPYLRDLQASGGALLTVTSTASQGRPGKGTSPVVTTTDRLSADMLRAHFVAVNGASELSTVHGSGKTSLTRVSSSGVEQTSSGDTLDARFRQKADVKGSVEIASAVQQGNVIIDRRLPAKRGSPDTGPEVQHAIAREASYDADSDRMTLTDGVQMSDASSTIWASRVVMDQDSGDAKADGSVKVNYAQSGTAEPVHILAARAEMNHDAGRAVFYGSDSSKGTNGLARMWQAGVGGQGGSQIEAPVLVLEQSSDGRQRRLIARAETPAEQGTVHAVLVSEPRARNGANKTPHQDVVRITSSQMVYSDAERQAEFTGGVRVLDGDGDLRARQAMVYLEPPTVAQPVAKPLNARPTTDRTLAATGVPGGKVQRIVATQSVVITQPGRRATGERLVYTAIDQMFVLTGTLGNAPKVVDAQQGTTTGALLRFHSGDNSVMVSGSDGDAPAQKVHTETRVKK
jgi:lipopolysaccharide export system protein LptA